jgi:hypothetical protein
MVTFVPRLVLLVSTVFIAAFQIRYSIATLEARNTFLFIPFQLKPYTNTIESVGQSAKEVLRRGDELMAVNDRPFTGMSVYRQELRAATRYLDAVNLLPPRDAVEALSRWPFRVTVRSGAADARTVNVYFAHCTCGSLDTSQVIWYCILPPAICIMLGLVVAAFSRLQSALPWLFLAVVVCLSLVPIVPEWSSSWSQVADPLEWRDWFRIPALAYQSFFGASWSAWLLLFAIYCFRRDASLTAWWAVTPILALAGLKTFVAIGSSESFRVVAPIYRALESASTGISVTLFLCAALITWSFGRRWALGSLILAACAATVLCWPASVPIFHTTWMYDNVVYYRTPAVVGACFTAAILLVVVVAGWRTLVASAKPKRHSGSGLLAILSMVLLLVPFMYSALSGVVALWWTRFVPQGVLISLYAGLLGAGWVVFSACRARTSSERSSRSEASVC